MPTISKQGGKILLANKVCICGIDTSSLPKSTNKELMKVMEQIKDGKEGAREEFIMLNMRLVLSIVQRFMVKEHNSDDIFQVGIIGLMKAIDNFDISVGVQFSTYAVPMIIGEIKRFLRDNNSVKVTRSLRDVAYKALQVREALLKVSNDEPTIDQIADGLDMPVRDVAYALDAIAEPVSLFDTVYNDDNDTFLVMDQIRDSSSEDSWVENTLLHEAINNLDDKERQILFMRYYAGKTQMEISSEIGISQAQVSRLEKNALKTIKGIV